MKLIKEDCPKYNSVTVRISTFKSFMTKILAGLNKRIKFVCVALGPLVTSLCSQDFLMMSLNTITIY